MFAVAPGRVSTPAATGLFGPGASRAPGPFLFSSSRAALWLAVAALVLLSGCAMPPYAPGIDFGRAPPADWPTLKVIEHDVPHAELLRLCGHLTVKRACAGVDFTRGVCRIFYSTDFPREESVMEHERAHCRGYDHPYDARMRDAWARWKEKNGR